MASWCADAGFWDESYRSGALGDEPFDWLFEFGDVPEAHWRRLLGPTTRRVVVVGCGHASLSREVAKLGYATLSVDSSATVIAEQRARHPELDALALLPNGREEGP